MYAPDNELWFIHQSIDERKDEFDEDERQLLEEMKEEQHWRGIEFMEDVDVLIHDSQYSPDDYVKKRGWGHSCYIDTVNSAIDARAKELILFSHDPSYDDDFLDNLQEHALHTVAERKSDMICRLAIEGQIIDLD